MKTKPHNNDLGGLTPLTKEIDKDKYDEVEGFFQ